MSFKTCPSSCRRQMFPFLLYRCFIENRQLSLVKHDHICRYGSQFVLSRDDAPSSTAFIRIGMALQAPNEAPRPLVGGHL